MSKRGEDQVWSLIFGKAKMGRRREEKRRRRGRREEEQKVWNLYGNYDFCMNYWTFGLLYGIV